MQYFDGAIWYCISGHQVQTIQILVYAPLWMSVRGPLQKRSWQGLYSLEEGTSVPKDNPVQKIQLNAAINLWRFTNRNRVAQMSH